MTIAVISLLESDREVEGFDTSKEAPRDSPEDLPVQEFVTPTLPAVKRSSLQERDVTVKKSVFRFGVVVENFDPEIVAEVIRDLIALVSSLPNDARLVVCSPNSADLWDKVRAVMPLDVQTGDFSSVGTWKVYWKEKKPKPPEGVKFKFEKRVGNPYIQKIILRPNTQVPTALSNPDANRPLPSGMSPSTKSPPYHGPVQMSPMIYLWSSNGSELVELGKGEGDGS